MNDCVGDLPEFGNPLELRSRGDRAASREGPLLTLQTVYSNTGRASPVVVLVWKLGLRGRREITGGLAVHGLNCRGHTR